MIKCIFIIILSGSLLVGCVTDSSSLRYGGASGSLEQRREILRTARRFVGVKYKHGGTTPAGFDCSGYVMYVYHKNGVQLPRAVGDQYQRGKTVPIRYARPGDLVFFTTGKSRYSHVGIYLGKLRFIHSPSTGKTVSIADMRNAYWKKRFIGSVTVLAPSRKPWLYSRRTSNVNQPDSDINVYN